MSKYSTLYEGIDLSQYTPKEIMDGKKLYDYIVESAEVAKAQNETIDDVMDEGIFGEHCKVRENNPADLWAWSPSV